MRASEIPFGKYTRRFSPTEWPEGVLDRMNPSVLFALFALRERMPPGAAFFPSPLPGAHVRDSGTSRHSIAGGRLSDATDFFVEWSWAFRVWMEAIRMDEIGGLGIYTDMVWKQPGRFAMFHIDTRPDQTLWLGWREGGVGTALEYVYFDKEPRKFMDLLAARAGSGA